MRLFPCPVRATADVIDGKGKSMIIDILKTGPLRFGQLHRRIPDSHGKTLMPVLTERLTGATSMELTPRRDSVAHR